MTRVFPVIHHCDLATTCANVELALGHGVTGVFLIQHGRGGDIGAVAADVHARFPDAWLGVNYLDRTAAGAIAVAPPFVKAIWSDRPGLHSAPNPADQFTFAETCAALGARSARGPLGFTEFFGSVAFKGIKREPAPAVVAAIAAKLRWTVTTSGLATGVAADLAKIAAMAEAVHLPEHEDARLAIASGVTPENVHEYLPYVDDILVATGISHDFHTFDATKLRSLMEAVLAHDAAQSARELKALVRADRNGTESAAHG